jgi:hypothetical protein
MDLYNLLNRFSQKSSGNMNEKHKVNHLIKGSKYMLPPNYKRVNDKKDDWANSSGIYLRLSDKQKRYVEKISEILDRVDDEI